MSRHTAPLALLLALPLVTAGCLSSGSPSARTASTATTTSAPPAQTMELTVFRLRDGRLTAETATVPQTTGVAAASLTALGLQAPVSIASGTATVDLPDASAGQVAEIVYTLTQFPTVQRVDVGGRTGVTRDDAAVASYLPAILVESPAAGAEVPRSFTVSGSASVFEATLVVELVQNGQAVVKRTVTASVGAPDRGTFDATLDAPAPGPAEVVAFAPSAENGAHQHEVDVPVAVSR